MLPKLYVITSRHQIISLTQQNETVAIGFSCTVIKNYFILVSQDEQEHNLSLLLVCDSFCFFVFCFFGAEGREGWKGKEEKSSCRLPTKTPLWAISDFLANWMSRRWENSAYLPVYPYVFPNIRQGFPCTSSMI